jgi:ADP-heptose:LPS heptosyltransferase
MRACLRKLGFDPKQRWIAAHCGASAASRRYGADRFARVFTLLRDCGRPILLTGNTTERTLIDEIVARCHVDVDVINLAGHLTLGELACLIDEADVLLSNNTGPVHLAAAVQTPVVDLYALTNPQHTPWQVPHRLLYHDVPCKYCYHSICPRGDNACLNGIEPEEVAQAVCELLDERQGNTNCTAYAATAAPRRHYAHPRN